MSGTTLGQRLNVWLSVVVVTIFIAMAAGCSSTGESSTSAGVGTGGTGSITVVGKVADGYLAGATVFLDRNNNYQPDGGEPSATTDANGDYTLNVDPADLGSCPIVALAAKGITIDKDTGTYVTSSYLFSMHAASVAASTTGAVSGAAGNFISPMSTLIREMMETGIYGSLPEAMEALRAKMGLPVGTNLMSDYIATGNTGMHTGARNIAAIMGGQMEQIFITNGSLTIIDVNRYRGMMGMIFTNMSEVMGTNTQTSTSGFSGTMTTMISGIPLTAMGQPYQNMSTAYRRTK